MLLKHLYDFAHSSHHKILADDAFESRAIRFVIELTSDGTLAGVQDVSPDGKRGFEFPFVPKTARVKKGKVAEFLVDGIDSLFGLSPDPTKPKDTGMLRAKFDDFWSQIAEAEKITRHPALASLMKFKPFAGEVPPFLSLDGGKWLVTTASGAKVRLGSAAFTFRHSGDLLFSEQGVIVPYWRAVFERAIAEQEGDSETGVCMITGDVNVPIARIHTPRISNIPNVGIDGTIVSFEKSAPAFSSYGKIQSNNAPCSVSATRAYSKGLQFLVDHSDHSVRIGQTCLCFWATEIPIAKTPLAFLNKPDPKVVRDFVRAPFAGIERELAQRDRFFAVTLAGNSGRIVVRHWLQVTVEEAVKNLQHWFADLEIDVPPRPPNKAKPAASEKDFHPLSIYWLCRATISDQAAKKLEKKLPPGVPCQLYRAALEGTAPSVALLKSLLSQLHSRLIREENYNLIYDESRFALLRLIINRHHRSRQESHMEIPPKQRAESQIMDSAYNCGRLLSVFNSLQRAAHKAGDARKELNTTIAERYFSSASSNPNSAFSILWKLHQHHLKKLRQGGTKGEKAAFRIKESITEICGRFRDPIPGVSPDFPRFFSLVEQGRFALGYYHEEAKRAAAIRTWLEKQKLQSMKPTGEEPDEEEILSQE